MIFPYTSSVRTLIFFVLIFIMGLVIAHGSPSGFNKAEAQGTGDITPPSVPVNLKVQSTTGNSVTLSWNPSFDNSGSVAHYTVYKLTGDTTPPVITLLGSNPMSVTQGGTFIDPGATATDNIDGDITNLINATGTVNTGVVGTYTRTYSVTDTAGNTGTANRTVNVAAGSGSGGTACDTSYNDVNGTLRYCNEIFTNSQIVVTHNIQYSSIDGENLLFDLYTPPLSDNVHDRPLWIFLHGGGGEIGDGGSVCNKAARLGYVCISGDYRGDGGHTPGGFFFADQKYAASDLFTLIRHARIHSHDYGIDPNRILVTGVSAGSVTGLTAVITADDMDNQSWYSSSDNLVNRGNQTYPDGSTVPSWACMAKGDSGPPSPPVNNLIDPNDPPIALFMGGQDLSHGWTCETGQTVVNIMQSMGIPSYFQCFPNSGHGLGEGPAIDAVTIPMAYKELIAESCPQSYSNIPRINN